MYDFEALLVDKIIGFQTVTKYTRMDHLEKNLNKPLFMRCPDGQLIEIILYDPTNTEPVARDINPAKVTQNPAKVTQKQTLGSKNSGQLMDVSTLQNIPSSQIVDSTSSKSLSAPVDIDLIGPSPSTSDYPDAEIAHPVLNQSKIPGASTNQPGSGSKRSKKNEGF